MPVSIPPVPVQTPIVSITRNSANSAIITISNASAYSSVFKITIDGTIYDISSTVSIPVTGSAKTVSVMINASSGNYASSDIVNLLLRAYQLPTPQVTFKATGYSSFGIGRPDYKVELNNKDEYSDTTRFSINCWIENPYGDKYYEVSVSDLSVSSFPFNRESGSDNNVSRDAYLEITATETGYNSATTIEHTTWES